MRTRANLFAGVILTLLLLALAGCTKKTGTGSSDQSRGGPAAASSSTAGSVLLKPVGRSGTGSASAPAAATSSGGSGVPQGTDRLLASRGGSTVFPSDYEIGALQPEQPAGTERGAIMRVVQEFFQGLTDGKIDTKLLSPQWKDELVRLLSGPIKKGELPESVRIGIVSVEQDKAHAAIRMEKGKGSAVGEIYLDRVDNDWYVSDIQASFADLEKPASQGAPFDPAEWKSMIKE